MDIKTKRRDVIETEGNYPTGKKSPGSASSDNNIGWDVRAMSFSRGADTDYLAIQQEAEENNERYGVPCRDSFPAPSDPAGPENCGARYQTASYDTDKPLPNPHNFSSNPGFMGAMGPSDAGNYSPATARSLQRNPGRSPQTRGGSTGSVTTVGGKNTSAGMPAPGDTNPYAEGGPLLVSSGYNG